MLILPIKREWFDLIKNGEKKEEYREIKPYWTTRLLNAFGAIIVDEVVVHGKNVPEEIQKEWPIPVAFRNGYSKDSPQITVLCRLRIGEGKPEWGAEPGKQYFILEIV